LTVSGRLRARRTYPRRWPQIAADDGEAFVLRLTSWLGVAAAGTAIWVAVSYLSVPVGWLALVLLLGYAVHRFGFPILAIEADFLTLASATVLVLHQVLPLFLFRLDYRDPRHHLVETAVLALAAMAYWVRAEVYPRVLPRHVSGASSDIDFGSWQAFAMAVTSCLGVAAAATALWVAFPDTWVPVGWLTIALLLSLASHWLSSFLLTLEADGLVLISAVVLAFHHVIANHHPAEALVLAIAAMAYWIRSELYPRVLPRLGACASPDPDLASWQTFALPATSWLGVAAAASALWVSLPASWVVVGWLTLVLALGIAADWVKAQTFALQADFLAKAAVPGIFVWDLSTQGCWDHRAPLMVSVVLLYAGMRRKTVLVDSPSYLAPHTHGLPPCSSPV